MKKFILVTLLISIASALIAIPAFAQSAQSTVSIVGHAFNPTETSIPAGGRITWNNTDAVIHTAASIAGQGVSWDSGDLAQNQSYSVIFNTPGTYSYVCKYHSWMTGRVVVQGSAQASPTPEPTATVTPPAATATPPAPASTPSATETPAPGIPSTGGSDPGAGETNRIFVFAGLGILVTTLSVGIWKRRRSAS